MTEYAEPFNALGRGNGFMTCIRKRSEWSNEDLPPTWGPFTLEEAMQIYWNLKKINISFGYETVYVNEDQTTIYSYECNSEFEGNSYENIGNNIIHKSEIHNCERPMPHERICNPSLALPTDIRTLADDVSDVGFQFTFGDGLIYNDLYPSPDGADYYFEIGFFHESGGMRVYADTGNEPPLPSNYEREEISVMDNGEGRFMLVFFDWINEDNGSSKVFSRNMKLLMDFEYWEYEEDKDKNEDGED